MDYNDKKVIILKQFDNNNSYTIDELCELTSLDKPTVSRVIHNQVLRIVKDYLKDNKNISIEEIANESKIPLPIIEKCYDKATNNMSQDTKIKLVVDTFLHYNGNITSIGLANLLNLPKSTIRRCLHHEKISLIYNEKIRQKIEEQIHINEEQRGFDNGYISSIINERIYIPEERRFVGSTSKYDEETTLKITLSIKIAKFLMINFELYSNFESTTDDICKIFKIDNNTYQELMTVLKEYDNELYNSLNSIYNIEIPGIGGR